MPLSYVVSLSLSVSYCSLHPQPHTRYLSHMHCLSPSPHLRSLSLVLSLTRSLSHSFSLSLVTPPPHSTWSLFHLLSLSESLSRVLSPPPPLTRSLSLTRAFSLSLSLIFSTPLSLDVACPSLSLYFHTQYLLSLTLTCYPSHLSYPRPPPHSLFLCVSPSLGMPITHALSDFPPSHCLLSQDDMWGQFALFSPLSLMYALTLDGCIVLSLSHSHTLSLSLSLIVMSPSFHSHRSSH